MRNFIIHCPGLEVVPSSGLCRQNPMDSGTCQANTQTFIDHMLRLAFCHANFYNFTQRAQIACN